MSRLQFDQEIQQAFPSVTPRKMRKLNEKINFDSTNSRQEKCLSSQIRLFKGLKRKNSYSMTNPMPFQCFSYSKDSRESQSPEKMQQEVEFKIMRNRSNSSSKNMFETFREKIITDLHPVQEINLPKLTHKFSLFDHESSFQGLDLDLNRHNSTIDTGNNFDQANYGDNVYIKNIQLKKTQSKIQLLKARSSKKNQRKTNLKRGVETIEQQSQEYDQRLRKDYQIKQKFINTHKNKHETFLCLNKLQRIFYYGKKVMIHFASENFDINISQGFQSKSAIPLQKRICSLQTQLSHKDNDYTLLKIVQSFQQNYAITMIFELASYSLEDHNSFGIRMKESEVWSAINDCAQSLKFLKSESCNHLNIKPGNILKCKEKFKLSDPYGKIGIFSEIINSDDLKYIETKNVSLFFPYTAPQLIEYRRYLDGINFEKSDIYSLGVSILTNLLGNEILFHIQQRQFQKIKKMVCKGLHNFSPTLKKILLRMISFDPSKRPDLQELTNVEFEQIQPKKNHKLQRSFSI